MANKEKTTKKASHNKASKKLQKKDDPELVAKQQAQALRKFLYPHATD